MAAALHTTHAPAQHGNSSVHRKNASAPRPSDVFGAHQRSSVVSVSTTGYEDTYAYQVHLSRLGVNWRVLHPREPLLVFALRRVDKADADKTLLSIGYSRGRPSLNLTLIAHEREVSTVPLTNAVGVKTSASLPGANDCTMQAYFRGCALLELEFYNADDCSNVAKLVRLAGQGVLKNFSYGQLCIHEGEVQKQTKSKTWTPRYLRLVKGSLCVFRDASSVYPVNVVPLKHAQPSVGSGKDCDFTLTVFFDDSQKKSFRFRTSTQRQRAQWIAALDEERVLPPAMSLPVAPPRSTHAAVTSRDSAESMSLLEDSFLSDRRSGDSIRSEDRTSGSAEGPSLVPRRGTVGSQPAEPVMQEPDIDDFDDEDAQERIRELMLIEQEEKERRAKGRPRAYSFGSRPLQKAHDTNDHMHGSVPVRSESAESLHGVLFTGQGRMRPRSQSTVSATGAAGMAVRAMMERDALASRRAVEVDDEDMRGIFHKRGSRRGPSHRSTPTVMLNTAFKESLATNGMQNEQRVVISGAARASGGRLQMGRQQRSHHDRRMSLQEFMETTPAMRSPVGPRPVSVSLSVPTDSTEDDGIEVHSVGSNSAEPSPSKSTTSSFFRNIPPPAVPPPVPPRGAPNGSPSRALPSPTQYRNRAATIASSPPSSMRTLSVDLFNERQKARDSISANPLFANLAGKDIQTLAVQWPEEPESDHMSVKPSAKAAQTRADRARSRSVVAHDTTLTGAAKKRVMDLFSPRGGASGVPAATGAARKKAPQVTELVFNDSAARTESVAAQLGRRFHRQWNSRLSGERKYFLYVREKLCSNRVVLKSHIWTFPQWLKLSAVFGRRSSKTREVDKALRNYRVTFLTTRRLLVSSLIVSSEVMGAAQSQIGFAFPDFDSQHFDVGTHSVVRPVRFFDVSAMGSSGLGVEDEEESMLADLSLFAYGAMDWNGALRSTSTAKELMQTSPDVTDIFMRGDAESRNKAKAISSAATNALLHDLSLAAYFNTHNAQLANEHAFSWKQLMAAQHDSFLQACKASANASAVDEKLPMPNQERLGQWANEILLLNPSVDSIMRLVMSPDTYLRELRAQVAAVDRHDEKQQTLEAVVSPRSNKAFATAVGGSTRNDQGSVVVLCDRIRWLILFRVLLRERQRALQLLISATDEWILKHANQDSKGGKSNPRSPSFLLLRSQLRKEAADLQSVLTALPMLPTLSTLCTTADVASVKAASICQRAQKNPASGDISSLMNVVATLRRANGDRDRSANSASPTSSGTLSRGTSAPDIRERGRAIIGDE